MLSYKIQEFHFMKVKNGERLTLNYFSCFLLKNTVGQNKK